ncbi:hypothetical protein J2Z53_001717 [Clostridium moniliforme]|uniref:Uncharacterized protein n=1 Tax=Clostridium moniliforme TaxID=39489 RepID=A0ABS4F1L2_9CLOT|nr:hypothetical protein [Clostridium moniliforme]
MRKGLFCLILTTAIIGVTIQGNAHTNSERYENSGKI